MLNRRPGLLFFVLATLTLTCLVTLASMGRPGAPPFSVLHLRQNVSWLVWALLSPAIIVVTRRFPFGSGSAIQWLLRHLAVGMVFSLAAVGLTLVLGHAFNPAGQDRTSVNPPLIAGIAAGLLLYTLIAVSYQAIAYHGAARAQEADAARLRADLAEARLMGIESKLQPHFLFNALNSVAALMRKDVPAAEEMLEQVCELLRASLQANPMQEVSFADALGLTEQYLAIEQVRYRDRLRVEVAVDEEARTCRVPQLLLQPLVENAIRHGLAPIEQGGCARITAKLSDGKLVVTVADDGVGFGNSPPESAGGGVGLKSIRSALAHLYGPHHSFEIKARHPRGTIASIVMPCRHGPQ